MRFMALVDRFERPVTSLRISLNSSDQCNFNCVYCHMEGVHSVTKSLMEPTEIEKIVSVLFAFDVDSVKLTGGEPMLRSDIVEIVESLRGIGLREVSMSTNGTRLADLAWELKEKGLNRVNINLPSLHEERFAFITGVDKLKETLTAVEAAVESRLCPVKLNMVMLRGVNDNEVEEMIEYSLRLGGRQSNIVQLIELVETDHEFYRTYHVNLAGIDENLSRRAVTVKERRLHRRLKYDLPNDVTVEVVRPVHNSSFCMADNRIRITHDGKFKPCLLREDNHVDFLTAMRRGAKDDELAALFKKAVLTREPYNKPYST